MVPSKPRNQVTLTSHIQEQAQHIQGVSVGVFRSLSKYTQESSYIKKSEELIHATIKYLSLNAQGFSNLLFTGINCNFLFSLLPPTFLPETHENQLDEQYSTLIYLISSQCHTAFPEVSRQSTRFTVKFSKAEFLVQLITLNFDSVQYKHAHLFLQKHSGNSIHNVFNSSFSS